MPSDPIERLSVDLEVFGIPQTPGMPPMTETYLHVRRRQDGAAESAVLGLPVYEGKPGPAGPAGMIHQGQRTTAELDGLALVLSPAELNYTYRNTDNNSQWIWNGTTFQVYANAYGAQGNRGPAPVMNGGNVTIDGEAQPAPAGVHVDGADGGPYTVSVALPALPPGPPGPPGLAGPIYTSVDVSQTTPPVDGQMLVHSQALGKLVWATPMVPYLEYVVSSESFPDATKNSGDVRHTLLAFEMPAQPFDWEAEILGGVDVFREIGHRIDIEVRLSSDTSGALIGYGRGSDGNGWERLVLNPYSAVPLNPGVPRTSIIPAGVNNSIWVTAIKKGGTTKAWGVRKDFANLRIRVNRVL
ncbi:hypothetical protein [Rhodococcus sp. UNC363MFTsu5.1]|uniref:hypothetical protein n=1 Tax=Rhodococcus sp. UNC363MFTsu5.1 TaxID=1449069 RepID=UPI000480F9BA|nr:hypothetical protein [Rhodococcus sp. UNC363MFTsu5.1]